MRQFIYIVLCLGLSATAFACGSPCGELQDVCDTCEVDVKTSCEEVANADEDNACDADLERFEELCN
jgi:hypothetical protein